jgi:two-component system NtrC family sensor kinase
MDQDLNTRLLIIDDDETIRDSFREILIPKITENKELETASSRLFKKKSQRPKSSARIFNFSLDEANSGQVGLQKIQEAHSEQKPYSVIFVDMRMPGWDGLETVQKIREIEKRAEIIFVTAYSDRSIDEIVEKAGPNVSYHCKPFEVDEIRQLATKAVFEWNKTRNLEQLINSTAELRSSYIHLKPLLNTIFEQLMEMTLSKNAVLLLQKNNDQYSTIRKEGAFCDPTFFETKMNLLIQTPEEEFNLISNLAKFSIDSYIAYVWFDDDTPLLSQEKLYLIHLYLAQANQSIENVRLQETAIRNEKLSAIGQAISMISHDLRGPIGNIKLALNLILDEYEKNQSLDLNIMKVVERETERTYQIVNDILDFTRGTQPNKSTVQTNLLIHSVRETLQPILDQHHVELVFNTNDIESIIVDESKIERTLINLIKNASEAMYHHRTTSPQVKVFINTDSEYYQIDVKDNGPGIPEEILPTLFQPFETFGKSKGTGLGLAISKQFVEAHDGTIDIETSDQGTTFHITIPIQSNNDPESKVESV